MLPAVALALPLQVAPSVILLGGAIVDSEEAFEVGCVGRDLKYWDSALNESTKMQWRFSDTIDRVVNFAPRGMKVTQKFTNRAS